MTGHGPFLLIEWGRGKYEDSLQDIIKGGQLVSTRSLANMTAMTWSQLSKRNHIWSLLRLQEGDFTQKVGRCVHIFGLVADALLLRSLPA